METQIKFDEYFERDLPEVMAKVMEKMFATDPRGFRQIDNFTDCCMHLTPLGKVVIKFNDFRITDAYQNVTDNKEVRHRAMSHFSKQLQGLLCQLPSVRTFGVVRADHKDTVYPDMEIFFYRPVDMWLMINSGLDQLRTYGRAQTCPRQCITEGYHCKIEIPPEWDYDECGTGRPHRGGRQWKVTQDSTKMDRLLDSLGRLIEKMSPVWHGRGWNESYESGLDYSHRETNV